MQEQNSIPISKVARATTFIKTGAKVGGNYLRHYGKKMFDGDLDKQDLHKDNAEDIYNALSKLKGSALKVAQMASMERNFLPEAYQDKFSLAQYNAPPLSYPLVVKTFRKTLGKGPEEIFETFSKKAVNAASIGQVHKATKGSKTLAVKIQYPGVADSISADLRLVKPVALRILNLSETEAREFLMEVESKLKEETDYDLELLQSKELTSKSSHLDGIYFPEYYEELSSNRILTMDWLEGQHLDDFLATNPSQDVRNMVGQRLWDLYNFQIHALRKVHADPHPGNFMIKQNGEVGIMDFGCVKVLPEDFYTKFFGLLEPARDNDDKLLMERFLNLRLIYPDDNRETVQFLFRVFGEMIELLGKPILSESFDFSDDQYFKDIYRVGEILGKSPLVRKSGQARGSRHNLYLNRTYFGLYQLLNRLGANIRTSVQISGLRSA